MYSGGRTALRRAAGRVSPLVSTSASPSEDRGEVGGWNTLKGVVSSSAPTESSCARSTDGWVSEDAEPPPPPPGQIDEYERDSSGRMVYAPRGFYYDAVRPGEEGIRLKVDVGVVGGRRQRTFVIRKTFSFSSDVVSVTMERPLGIVFERDTEGMVRVADMVQGSRAGRAAAVERLQGGGFSGAAVVGAPRRGDVLRAFSTTTLSFGPRAQLLGDLSGTKRAVVLFGCDGQPWNKVVGALKAGLVADGPVTLLLERARDQARADAWTAEEIPSTVTVTENAREGKGGGGAASSSAAGRESEEGEARRADRRAGSRSNGAEDETSVPDALNQAFLVSVLAFLLLIFVGFNP